MTESRIGPEYWSAAGQRREGMSEREQGRVVGRARRGPVHGAHLRQEDPDEVGARLPCRLELVMTGTWPAEHLGHQAPDGHGQADCLVLGTAQLVSAPEGPERVAVRLDGGQPDLDAGRRPVLGPDDVPVVGGQDRRRPRGRASPGSSARPWRSGPRSRGCRAALSRPAPRWPGRRYASASGRRRCRCRTKT